MTLSNPERRFSFTLPKMNTCTKKLNIYIFRKCGGVLTGQYDQSDPDIMLGNIYQLISETGSCACTTHFGWCGVHITSKKN